MKYQIGQTIWRASWEHFEARITCPDCAGEGRLRVILPDDSIVSIECQGCSWGYEGPHGYVRVHDRKPIAVQEMITGVEIGAKTEWRTSGSYIVEEDKLFDSQEAAEARAAEMAIEADREERERINRKEKDTRSWGWHVRYHRREIKEAQRRIEYHTKKLAVANLKAKDKTNA